MKHFLASLSLPVLALILASCGPLIVSPPLNNATPTPAPPQEVPVVKSTQPTQSTSIPRTVNSPDQKALRNTIPPIPEQTTKNVVTPDIPKLPASYPVAIPIPGKPGYVFNPYNNNPVYVEGIPSGKTVLDPADPNQDHKFKVPWSSEDLVNLTHS